jgi:hypothetical protein
MNRLSSRIQTRRVLVFAFLISLLVPGAPGQLRFPPGAEKAVAAFHALFPTADLEGINSPGPGDPAAAIRNVRLYWVLRFQEKGRSKEALITPDGLLVRTRETVPLATLSEPLVQAIKKESAIGTFVRVQAQTTYATLKYVSAEAPLSYFGADVEKDGRTFKVNVRPDGSADLPMDGIASGLLPDGSPPYAASPTPRAKPEEISLPEAAVGAVRAVKAALPGAIVRAFRETVYDDKAGHIDIVAYDLDVDVEGKPKTVPVSAEGLLVYITLPVKTEDIPPRILAAISAKVPGGAIKQVVRQDVLAVPKFVPLEKSRFAYVAEIETSFLRRRQFLPFSPEGRLLEVFRRGSGR